MIFSKRRVVLGFSIVLALLPVAPGVAFAQRAAADVESARELYTQGRELREHGDLRGALEKLKAAHALGKTPITGLELAKTFADLHQPLEARELCLSIARMPVSTEETARSAEARQDAAKMAEAVKPQIATLRIKINGVPQGTEPTLLIDGLAVPFAAISEPRKVNPGAHAISARIGAGAEATASASLTDGETRDVELTVVPPSAPQAPVAARPPSAETPPRPREAETKMSPLVLPGLAVAAVGLGVAAVTGTMALVAKGDLETQCDAGRCGPESYDALDRARSLGTASTVSFIVGAIGGIVGVYGLTHPVPASGTGASAMSTKPTVHPYVGAGSLGFHGSF